MAAAESAVTCTLNAASCRAFFACHLAKANLDFRFSASFAIGISIAADGDNFTNFMPNRCYATKCDE